LTPARAEKKIEPVREKLTTVTRKKRGRVGDLPPEPRPRAGSTTPRASTLADWLPGRRTATTAQSANWRIFGLALEGHRVRPPISPERPGGNRWVRRHDPTAGAHPVADRGSHRDCTAGGSCRPRRTRPHWSMIAPAGFPKEARCGRARGSNPTLRASILDRLERHAAARKAGFWRVAEHIADLSRVVHPFAD